MYVVDPENVVFFQQDGAVPYYAAPVRDFLNQHFGRRVSGLKISRPITIRLFLWDYLKTVVYKTKALENVRHRIVQSCGEMWSEMFGNMFGSQFEDLINQNLFVFFLFIWLTFSAGVSHSCFSHIGELCWFVTNLLLSWNSLILSSGYLSQQSVGGQ